MIAFLITYVVLTYSITLLSLADGIAVLLIYLIAFELIFLTFYLGFWGFSLGSNLSKFFSGSVNFLVIPSFEFFLIANFEEPFKVRSGGGDFVYEFLFSSSAELYLDPYFPLTEAVG
jgi:hypothetical protein